MKRHTTTQNTSSDDELQTEQADELAPWRDTLLALPGYDPIATAGDCYFVATEAEHAIGFVESSCRHVKGALTGNLIRLELWQRSILANVFGWYRPDGTRRYREVLVFIPRKNGKTTLAALITCVVAFTDDEGGMELYSTAAESDQARICFLVTRGMIEAEPQMKRRAELYKYSIVFPEVAGAYRALTAKAETKHGFNPHLCLNDELWAHKTKDLTVAMESGMGSRRQPLIVHLTTSDYEREGSVCNDKHDYATKVRDGVINDPYFLPVIYEADRDDDWTSETVWEKANPNIDVSVARDYLQRECKKAQDSPVRENEFKRLHLNIRTEQAERAIQMAHWDACTCDDDLLSLLAGREAWGGLDLSSKKDLTAFVLAVPVDELVYLLPWCWCPAENAVERERQDRAPYVTWRDEGLIEFTPGNSIDYAYIEKRVVELHDVFQINDVAFDNWNANATANRLRDCGCTMVEFVQGIRSYAEPTAEFERLIVAHDLRHDGHKVMRWCVSNLAFRVDVNENKMPAKHLSFEKIDICTAGIMALGRLLAAQRPDEPSIYETEDPLVL